MPPKRQGRRAESLLASPTAPECLVFAIGLRRIAARAFRRLGKFDLILRRNANDVEVGWMGFRSSEILRQGLEGGPIVLRARGFCKISALTGVTTPVTLLSAC
ncbi:hypothetical protein ALC62_06114 [Cyphomyrmex costatus]|uniref:Uncharacterized protein n=1 Tax=Cyphomyrmex costatus TaxID=456900 RepID=A0A195CQU9_9HYME|nr:hypothetical protein ALC62_06114 [Cyphomyrmex costatus]